MTAVIFASHLGNTYLSLATGISRWQSFLHQPPPITYNQLVGNFSRHLVLHCHREFHNGGQVNVTWLVVTCLQNLS